MQDQAVQAVQIDIFGGEHELAPTPAPRAQQGHEQPRLFEPQYEGQLWLADNPEIGAEAPER
jgi:hypothetical protein